MPIRKEDIARGLDIEREDFYKKTKGLYTMNEDLLFIYTPNTVDSLTKEYIATETKKENKKETTEQIVKKEEKEKYEKEERKN